MKWGKVVDIEAHDSQALREGSAGSPNHQPMRICYHDAPCWSRAGFGAKARVITDVIGTDVAFVEQKLPGPSLNLIA